MLADRAAGQSERIEEQFRTNGRAALKIGPQLEMAEAKKRQCDTASLLIRRWWMMENLAEQEELSVDEEVRGAVRAGSSSARRPRSRTASSRASLGRNFAITLSNFDRGGAYCTSGTSRWSSCRGSPSFTLDRGSD